ncbi:MAG: hypothetical protein JRD89_09260, partial [Deltaproteobacteria bacterium]|nr:hypothetical protein [Deltaproteobacteria bacterium]
MAITHKTDHTEEAIANLLTQFKGKEKIEAYLSSFTTQIQEVEDMLQGLLTDRGMSVAVGEQKDGLGKIVGERRLGRDDTDYQVAINGKILINKQNSTVNDMLEAMNISFPANWEFVHVGNASFRMYLQDAWVDGVDPSLAALEAALQRASGGGIG